MLIRCESCSKSFNVQDDLIPSKGRMLQCGSCQHKWFFIKEKIAEEKIEKIHKNDEIKKNVNKITKNESQKIEIKTVDNKNYFKLFLVIIISFTSLIIIIDTFKNEIAHIFPNIEVYLNNLYETLKDIKLFIIDLIK